MESQEVQSWGPDRADESPPCVREESAPYGADPPPPGRPSGARPPEGVRPGAGQADPGARRNDPPGGREATRAPRSSGVRAHLDRGRGLHEQLLGQRPLEAELSLALGRGLALLDRPGCTGRLGLTSFADLTREWVGFSGAKGRKLVRLAERLPELPSLGTAYRAGILSYSHVLELLDAATPEKELGWLASAMGRPYAQVRGMVRAAAGKEERELVALEVRPVTRSVVRWGTRLVGRLEGGPVPAADAIEAIATETISTFGPEDLSGGEEEARVGCRRGGRRESPRARAPGEEFLTNPPPVTLPEPPPRPELPEPSEEQEPWELLATVRSLSAMLGSLHHQKGRLLRALRDGRFTMSLCALPFKAYVATVLREDPSHAFRLVRRDERLDHYPRIRAAHESGRLPGSRVDLLLEVVTPATEEAWVAHALECTARWLRWEIEALEELRDRNPDLWETTKGMPQGEAGMRRLGLRPGFAARGLAELLSEETEENGHGSGICGNGGKVCAHEGEAGGGERPGSDVEGRASERPEGRGPEGGRTEDEGRHGERGRDEPRERRVALRFRLTAEVRSLLEEAIRLVEAHVDEVRDGDGALLYMVKHVADCQVGGVRGLERIARRYPVHERDGWI